MSGRIIFEPSLPTACDRGSCEGKPKAEAYRDGTVWQCDECGSKWEVWSGAQYNEQFSAWRRIGEPTPGWGADRTIGASDDLIELCPAHRGSYGTCDTCAEYLPCSCSDCECREIHIMQTARLARAMSERFDIRELDGG